MNNDWNRMIFDLFRKYPKDHDILLRLVGPSIDDIPERWKQAIFNAGRSRREMIFISQLATDDCPHLRQEFLLAAFAGACFHGLLDIANQLIDDKLAEVDVNTGLELACCGGQREIANLMLDNGADGFNGALSRACLAGNIEMGQLMIDRGATNLDIELARSRQLGNSSFADMLILNGAKRGY